jgi:hypothetical protein
MAEQHAFLSDHGTLAASDLCTNEYRGTFQTPRGPVSKTI